ncbi:MAG TPA: hypothetical protein VNB22_04175 [Pyrinomonadaceae bacterium]|nr:hypothetical protein [Pyrinomonadaceae bacterium]
MKSEDWGIIEYALVDCNDPRKDALANGFDEIYANGGHLIVCLETQEPELFDRSITTISNDKWRLQKFLTSPSVVGSVAELGIPNLLEPPEHCVLGSYAFEGALTDTLIAGGCYETWKQTEDEARKIARDFVDMISENNRSNLLTFRILGNWTDWFDNLGCDTTFISCNFVTRKLWFVCTTDYD